MMHKVVPHAGTWIEIVMPWKIIAIVSVVPHAGTWIEIQPVSMHPHMSGSFPTRERGLKQINWSLRMRF